MSKSTNGAGHKPAPKRTITAWKGNRTVRAPSARITPQALEALRAILQTSDLSYADWLTAHIDADTAPAPKRAAKE